MTDLDSLKDIPPPRRTDAAFARSVKAGVRARRSRTFFALPALAAAAAAFVFLVMRTGPAVEVDPVIAMAPVTAAPSTSDPFDDDDALFALPELEGSSDDELAQLDQVLDRKIARAVENRRSR